MQAAPSETSAVKTDQPSQGPEQVEQEASVGEQTEGEPVTESNQKETVTGEQTQQQQPTAPSPIKVMHS